VDHVVSHPAVDHHLANFTKIPRIPQPLQRRGLATVDSRETFVIEPKPLEVFFFFHLFSFRENKLLKRRVTTRFLELSFLPGLLAAIRVQAETHADDDYSCRAKQNFTKDVKRQHLRPGHVANDGSHDAAKDQTESQTTPSAPSESLARGTFRRVAITECEDTRDGPKNPEKESESNRGGKSTE
jgi:hypothetical protein